MTNFEIGDRIQPVGRQEFAATIIRIEEHDYVVKVRPGGVEIRVAKDAVEASTEKEWTIPDPALFC